MILIFKIDDKYLHHYLSLRDAKKILIQRLENNNIYRIKIKTSKIEEFLPVNLKSKILRCSNGTLPVHTVVYVKEVNNDFLNFTVSELLAYAVGNVQFCLIHYNSATITIIS